MKEITKDWLDSATDDLKIITKLTDDETLTHQIAFHAQQAIEKTLKALVEEYEIGLIRTHSLETLIAKTNPYLKLPIDLTFLKKLDQLYIEARYPGDFGLLPNGKPSIREALHFEQVAKEIYKIIYTHLA
jgi:HEPN domain-containing protein